MVQWLSISLPMQVTRVQSLVQEGPTCHRATDPVLNPLALEPHTLQQEKPPQRETLTPQVESSHHSLQLGKAHSAETQLSQRKIIFKREVLGIQRRQWHPTPVLLPRKSHGQRSLVDCSPWGR